MTYIAQLLWHQFCSRPPLYKYRPTLCVEAIVRTADDRCKASCQPIQPSSCRAAPASCTCSGTSFDQICNSLLELRLRAAHERPHILLSGIISRVIYWLQSCASAPWLLQVHGLQCWKVSTTSNSMVFKTLELSHWRQCNANQPGFIEICWFPGVVQKQTTKFVVLKFFLCIVRPIQNFGVWWTVRTEFSWLNLLSPDHKNMVRCKKVKIAGIFGAMWTFGVFAH